MKRRTWAVFVATIGAVMLSGFLVRDAQVPVDGATGNQYPSTQARQQIPNDPPASENQDRTVVAGDVGADRPTGSSIEKQPAATAPITHEPSPTTGNAPPTFPTDRYYSEWVTGGNQHQVLAAIANGEIGPGNLFSVSSGAWEPFRARVEGIKGWHFEPLSESNAREYRVFVNGDPKGFLVVQGRSANAAQYQIHNVEWWNERIEVVWARIRWDNLPTVLTSVVLGQGPNAEQLFSDSKAYDKFNSLFPNNSWEFRAGEFRGGMMEIMVDVVQDGRAAGSVRFFINREGIEDMEYNPSGW